MNELKIFENQEFGSIRTIEESGNVLFCGKDVATALGYTNAAKAHRIAESERTHGQSDR